MNQRICVRAIIKKNDKILFLRRAAGRPAVLGKYQLPGGRVRYGEMPDEALAAYIKETTGLKTQVSQLKSVVSYVDHNNRELHYLYLVYVVGVSGKDKVALNQRYDHYEWKPPQDALPSRITEATRLILSISQHSDSKYVDKKTTSTNAAIIYSDGGSRGNPGPSAAGYIIMTDHEAVVHEGGAYLGVTTNNVAEYQAVKLALEKALELGFQTIDFRVDSLLVANQMKGIYRVKNRELWTIHENITELMTRFKKVRFSHVRREFNQPADSIVNKVLDAQRNASQDTL